MELDLLGIDASRASLGAKTGTEWYSREIIRAMATLDDRPRLRLYQREPERFVHANRVEWQPIDRQRLWTHLGLANEMRATDIDALFVPAHVIPWRHPKTTVVTVHDLGYLQESRSHTLKRRITLDLTTRWNARAATRIITPSEQTRDDLAREYGVASSKIDVIPHGVDRDRFRPSIAMTWRMFSANSASGNRSFYSSARFSRVRTSAASSQHSKRLTART
ncbi:MAG: glycosyltransferase [Thermomicrobiales bacterium]